MKMMRPNTYNKIDFESILSKKSLKEHIKRISFHWVILNWFQDCYDLLATVKVTSVLRYGLTKSTLVNGLCLTGSLGLLSHNQGPDESRGTVGSYSRCTWLGSQPNMLGVALDAIGLWNLPNQTLYNLLATVNVVNYLMGVLTH